MSVSTAFRLSASHNMLTRRTDVSTQQSGSGSKGSMMGSKKQNSQTGWASEPFRGKSNTFVEAGDMESRDIDAQSDNSERAIVVKTTVDIR